MRSYSKLGYFPFLSLENGHTRFHYTADFAKILVFNLSNLIVSKVHVLVLSQFIAFCSYMAHSSFPFST